jgi:hypothetical protein
MKHDYTTFDAKLLELIRAGTVTATALTNALEPDCKQFEKTTAPFPCPAYRVVDKRLQALRKAGKVRYGRNDWQVIE